MPRVLRAGKGPPREPWSSAPLFWVVWRACNHQESPLHWVLRHSGHCRLRLAGARKLEGGRGRELRARCPEKPREVNWLAKGHRSGQVTQARLFFPGSLPQWPLINQPSVPTHHLGDVVGLPACVFHCMSLFPEETHCFFCDTCLSSLTASPGSWETIWTPQPPLCCSFSKSQLPLLEGKGAGNATVLDSLLEGRKEVPCQCSTNSWLKITFFFFFFKEMWWWIL